LATALLASFALAQDNQKPAPTKVLKIGDPAPDFAWPKPDRPETSKDTVRLADLKGKKSVLIAFYPKAFTGGCTTQLCGYRDDISKFRAADTEVVAVSTDRQVVSDSFRREMKMPFAVLGDPDHKVIDAYGIPLKASNGEKYAQRAVVLVDRDGKIQYVDMNYEIGKDEQPMYDAIKKLAPPPSKGEKQG
jgi:peroxiredoxin